MMVELQIATPTLEGGPGNGHRLATLLRRLPQRATSRRHLTASLLGTGLTFGTRARPERGAAKKKRKKKCPAGETRCPKGFPSRCCPPEAECCDTSRLGCCEG